VKPCVEKGLNFGPTILTMLKLTNSSLSSKQFLAQKLITEVEKPLYSSDLASKDFSLISKIKSALK
jgi:hypothetical protein